jgi:hypothetical protein
VDGALKISSRLGFQGTLNFCEIGMQDMVDRLLRNNGIPCLLAVCLALAAVGCRRETPAERAAVPIVEKNVAARGGLAAWRAVHSISMSGAMDAGRVRDPVETARALQKLAGRTDAERRQALLAGQKEAGKLVRLPFVMEMQRPRKMRLEIEFSGQTAVQVFDGRNGWKLRPFLNRHEVEAYTAEEKQVASEQQDLDGPLIDYAAKGNQVELEGTEPVEGRDAYKLKLTLKEGQVRHLWIDTETFLDVKSEGPPRRLDGKYHAVETYYRDYRPVDGLMIPYLLETSVEGVKGSEKITIERVALNPKLEDSRFAKPE